MTSLVDSDNHSIRSMEVECALKGSKFELKNLSLLGAFENMSQLPTRS